MLALEEAREEVMRNKRSSNCNGKDGCCGWSEAHKISEKWSLQEDWGESEEVECMFNWWYEKAMFIGWPKWLSPFSHGRTLCLSYWKLFTVTNLEIICIGELLLSDLHTFIDQNKIIIVFNFFFYIDYYYNKNLRGE